MTGDRALNDVSSTVDRGQVVVESAEGNYLNGCGLADTRAPPRLAPWRS
ncbi:hypothetical protein [Nitratireductor luteus]|nr:hypothetical protein [Nitratireductor luteus]